MTYGQQARSNPLDFIVELSHIPLPQQRLYLMMIGEGLRQRQKLPCNPFGGMDACVPVNASSKFASLCHEYDLKVDCVYLSEEMVDVENDPTDDLVKAMKDRGVDNLRSACSSCFDNQRSFWCAQTVPKCGSFSTTIERALFPAIAAIDTARDYGKTQLDALSDAVPLLLNASSLTMPCREILFIDQQQMLDDADDEDVKNLLSSYTPGAKKQRGGSSVALVLLSTVACLVLVAACVLIWYRYGSMFVRVRSTSNEGGYVSLGPVESHGAYEPPAEQRL
ncbi:g10352 [Coccomyxa elongata]